MSVSGLPDSGLKLPSDPASFTQLQQWLDWQENLHPSEIELGLQRLKQVLYRLYPQFSLPARQTVDMPYTVITIAGTNGKGSTVAMLESILTQAGYTIGTYTSPHLQQYNERIRINKIPVDDQLICDAFSRINKHRDNVSLTYFEFGTLAAIEIFYRQQCDIVILEVGLGGRLDAVNAVEPDIAFVSTVDFDHQDWLGDDLDSIALEKAGIYRNNRPAIYGDEPLISSIAEKVTGEALEFYQFAKDYNYRLREQQWDWLPADGSPFEAYYNLPLPALGGQIQLKNAANVLFILQLLRSQWPVSQAEIKRGLLTATLAGRFQILKTEPLVVADVAHNVQAARVLRKTLQELSLPGKWHIIVGMLKDKDITSVLLELKTVAESWSIIELDTPRAMPAEAIRTLVKEQLGQDSETHCFTDFKQAYQYYNEYNNKLKSSGGDQNNLLVFGSFFTVSEALQFFGE